MSIMKNKIPILEFDTEYESVIMPNHEKLDLHLPRKAVFAFLGEHIHKYAQTHGCKQVSTFVSATKVYPVYVTNYRGEDICLCQASVDSAAAAQFMDWLIGYGVKEIISDSLANIDKYDERNWGGDSFEYALKFCLDAVVEIK